MFFNHSFNKVFLAVLMVGAAIPARAGKDNESGVVHLGLFEEENGVFGGKDIDYNSRFNPSLIEGEQENYGVLERTPVPLNKAQIRRITKAGKKIKREKKTRTRNKRKTNKSVDPSNFPSVNPTSFIDVPSDQPSNTPSKEPSVDTLECDPDRLSVPAAIDFSSMVSDYLDGDTAVSTAVRSTYGEPMGCWKTSAVTDMSYAFSSRSTFTGEDEFIERWETSSVETMEGMFAANSAFNQPIQDWDVTSVTSMKAMFYSNTAFNQPIQDWDVSSVQLMDQMFKLNHAFNQPIQDWDVASVELMEYMFTGNTAFNQPIGDWDVGSVISMKGMFESSQVFNQCLSSWAGKLTGNVDMSNIYSGSVCTLRTDPTIPFVGTNDWCGCELV